MANSFTNKVIRGDCLDVLKTLPSKSVDLIASDPPYGLGFAGEKWDQDLPSEDIWRECLRILKPGSFAFVMTTPRQDCLAELISRMARAGFDVSHSPIFWAYLSGFPKSLDVSLNIDLKLGVERPVAGEVAQPGGQMQELSRGGEGRSKGTAWTGIKYDDKPITPQAEDFAGWRSPGLKPATEVIVVAMGPMSEKNYASQALKSLEDGSEGMGCFNIDACRIPWANDDECEVVQEQMERRRTKYQNKKCTFWGDNPIYRRPLNEEGRYPANMLVSNGALGPDASRRFDLDAWWAKMIESLPDKVQRTFPFLLEPKPTIPEKDLGCENLFWELDDSEYGYHLVDRKRWEELGKEEEKVMSETGVPCRLRARGNIHITVKPISLFCYLLTLASKPGQVVLDPFAGSGTTGVAAKIINRKYILVDLHEENCEIARRRIRDAGLPLFDRFEDAP